MARLGGGQRERFEGAPRWRRNFAFLWLSQLMAMVGFSSAMPFLPLYVQSLGIADPGAAAIWAGPMSSAGGLMMAVMAPVWGALADRYGRKPMVWRAMIGGGAIVSVMGFANDVRQLLFLRTVQGAFSGTVAAARVMVASIVPSTHLGQSLGLMATAAFVGQSAGPLLGGFVAEHFGFNVSFIITGVLLILSGIGVIFFVEESFRRPAPAARRGGLRRDLAVLIEFPQIRAVIVAMFIVQVGQMAASPVLPLYVKDLVGSDESAASTVGLILGATAVTSAVAASIGGRLGDRLGHQRVLAAAAILSGLLYLPQAAVQSPWQLLVLRALLGAFAGGIMPVAMAIVGLLTPPENRGWVFGLTATATALGNALGPILGATVAAQFNLRASFVFTAVALSAAGLWVALMLRTPAAMATCEAGRR